MRTSKIAYLKGGLRDLLAHFAGRLLGKPKYLNSASTIDFRNSKLKSCKTISDMLLGIVPEKSLNEISESLSQAIFLLEGVKNDSNDYGFPERWNSGINLQVFLCSLILLVKPGVVIETGTANGASALAISLGLSENNFGHLWSLDVKDCDAKLVPNELRTFVSFVKYSGSTPELREILKNLQTPLAPNIFLHDSDHSYLGQMSEYASAIDLEFDFLVSDDIDASLAFCDFARNLGSYLYDEPKFIGAIRNPKR